MAEYKVVEIFESINGEGQKAGQLAVFVRFQGCNLDCSYCDTRWANEKTVEYTLMTEQDIVGRVRAAKIKNVTLTGGEPLLQKGINVLLEAFAEEVDLKVEIETNGTMPIAPYDSMKNRPSMTMDYKLPSSGMEASMCVENFAHIKESDTVKFVCGSMEDLERAAEILETYQLMGKCKIYLSPVFGEIEPAQMVDFMKERTLNYVNLQLQLHKFIWGPEERGV